MNEDLVDIRTIRGFEMASLDSVSGSDHSQFLSSPYFSVYGNQNEGSHQEDSATSSLLTFADMVLACDHRQTNVSDENAEKDHSYASSNNSVMTMGSVLQYQNPSFSTQQKNHINIGNNSGCQEEYLPGLGELKIDINDESTSSSASTSPQRPVKCSPQDLDHNYRSTKTRKISTNSDTDTLVKRSLSVENVQETGNLPHADSFLTKISIPQTSSPRKSCSVEEVNNDHDYEPFASMKSSKSTENVQKNALSQPLHRVVNDRLEFPIWPRKADHTYATATWDGTAVSQSLFNDEVCDNIVDYQGCAYPNVKREHAHEDHDMEVIETKCDLKDFINTHRVGQNLLFKHNPQPKTPVSLSTTMCKNQKEDHTYFNSKATTCATVPRNKMRDDHTYFHSGITKKAGKEGTSMQTVADDMNDSANSQQIQADNLLVQCVTRSSAKDHNYSTSA